MISRLPLVRQRVDQILFRCCPDPAEHITQIGHRFQFMIADIGKNRLKPCKTRPRFMASHKEAVVTVFGNPANLPLTTIVGQIYQAVFQTMQDAGIFRKDILDRFEKLRFFLRVQQVVQSVLFLFQLVEQRGESYIALPLYIVTDEKPLKIFTAVHLLLFL